MWRALHGYRGTNSETLFRTCYVQLLITNGKKQSIGGGPVTLGLLASFLITSLRAAVGSLHGFAASRKAKLLHNLVFVERYKQASLCQDLVGKHNGSKVRSTKYGRAARARAHPLRNK